MHTTGTREVTEMKRMGFPELWLMEVPTKVRRKQASGHGSVDTACKEDDVKFKESCVLCRVAPGKEKGWWGAVCIHITSGKLPSWGLAVARAVRCASRKGSQFGVGCMVLTGFCVVLAAPGGRGSLVRL